MSTSQVWAIQKVPFSAFQAATLLCILQNWDALRRGLVVHFQLASLFPLFLASPRERILRNLPSHIDGQPRGCAGRLGSSYTRQCLLENSSQETSASPERR